jgi:hypothetical protein
MENPEADPLPDRTVPVLSTKNNQKKAAAAAAAKQDVRSRSLKIYVGKFARKA